MSEQEKVQLVLKIRNLADELYSSHSIVSGALEDILRDGWRMLDALADMIEEEEEV